MKFGGLSLTLGAAAALALLIVGASLSTTAGSNPDTDADGVVDLVDNCLGKKNSVNTEGWQDDCDLDGFGDECDGDLNNSGAVNITDYILFGASFNKSHGDANWNHCADMNASGTVNITDYILFGGQFNKVPGPSGLKCASTDATAGNMTGRNRCWFLPNHRVRCPHVGPDRAAAADANDILTNATNGRDLRFINKHHYADRVGELGGHCVFP